jgi:hypothetical protein
MNEVTFAGGMLTRTSSPTSLRRNVWRTKKGCIQFLRRETLIAGPVLQLQRRNATYTSPSVRVKLSLAPTSRSPIPLINAFSVAREEFFVMLLVVLFPLCGS